MRRRLCDTLHGRPSQLLIALPAAVVDRWPTVRPESRFVPPPTAFDVPVREGGVPVGILPRRLVWKTRMVCLPVTRFDRIDECDGRTHRCTHTHTQTSHDGIGRAA